MHELALARSVVAIARRHAEGRRVYAVALRVGRLRQVVPSALDFAFTAVTAGTELDGARLVIEDVPVTIACRACGQRTELDDFPLRCARCGDADVAVVAGEELTVTSLEVEDDDVTTGRQSCTAPR